MTDDRCQMSDVRIQTTDIRIQMTENRCQRVYSGPVDLNLDIRNFRVWISDIMTYIIRKMDFINRHRALQEIMTLYVNGTGEHGKHEIN